MMYSSSHDLVTGVPAKGQDEGAAKRPVKGGSDPQIEPTAEPPLSVEFTQHNVAPLLSSEASRRELSELLQKSSFGQIMG